MRPRSRDAAEASTGVDAGFCTPAFGGALLCNHFDQTLDPAEITLGNGVALDSFAFSSPNSALATVPANATTCAFNAVSIVSPAGTAAARVRASAKIFVDPTYVGQDRVFAVTLDRSNPPTIDQCAVYLTVAWVASQSRYAVTMTQDRNGTDETPSTSPINALAPSKWTRVEIDADFINGSGIHLFVDGAEVGPQTGLLMTCAKGRALGGFGFYDACPKPIARKLWIDDVLLEWM